MVENSARNLYKPNNKNVTSKRRRRPNPWAGESMFRPPKNNLPPMTPMRIYFPSLKKNNNKKVKTTPKERIENIMKLKNKISILLNASIPMQNRENAAKVAANLSKKYYTEYIQSEGPSSGAPKILLKRYARNTSNQTKIIAALIAASSVYGTTRFLKNKGKYILPFVLASMARK